MNLAAYAGTNSTTRREFLKTSTKAVAGAALTAAIARPGYTAEANTIQVALVGCGGRGTGAAANALATTSGPIKLVAMADVFAGQIKRFRINRLAIKAPIVIARITISFKRMPSSGSTCSISTTHIPLSSESVMPQNCQVIPS